MVHRRLYRRLVALLLAFCVLFAQSAALAYACQRHALPVAEAATPCAAHLAEADASKAGVASGNVCEVHCHDASLPDAGATDVVFGDVVIAWRLPEPMAVAPVVPATELEAKSAAPPPRTLFARLLI
jgi:hypothetical protein